MSGRISDELRGRTKRYALNIVKLYRQLPNRGDARVLGHQLLRSGTSVAAHVREASRARSRAEFASKLAGGLQEADESGLWLELLEEGSGISAQVTQPLLSETNELIAIMTTMERRTREKISGKVEMGKVES